MNPFLNIIKRVPPLRILHGEEGDEMTLSLATLVLTIMLVCYIIIGPLLRQFQIKIFRASGVIMILGIILTLLTKLINPESSFFKGFQFNHSLFFTFILPMVIFSFAYNSKIEAFLKYLKYILLFSIPGTFISFIIISIVTYYFNNQQYFTTDITSEDGTMIKVEVINLSLLEILQFAAAISASDSVISLSFLMEDNEPKLNAISLGDSIFNNAIAISIFNAVYDMSQKEKTLTATRDDGHMIAFAQRILQCIAVLDVGGAHLVAVRQHIDFAVRQYTVEVEDERSDMLKFCLVIVHLI